MLANMFNATEPHSFVFANKNALGFVINIAHVYLQARLESDLPTISK